MRRTILILTFVSLIIPLTTCFGQSATYFDNRVTEKPCYGNDRNQWQQDQLYYEQQRTNNLLQQDSNRNQREGQQMLKQYQPNNQNLYQLYEFK